MKCVSEHDSDSYGHSEFLTIYFGKTQIVILKWATLTHYIPKMKLE